MYNIAVIGAGVIGLTTATAIQDDLKSIAKVTIYTEKLSPDTTSDVAAGLWGPYLLQKTNVDKVAKWSKLTHDLLFDLWRNGHADEAGITLIPVKSVLETDSNKNIVFGQCHLTPSQLEEISKVLQSKYTSGSNYVTFTCESTKFLPFLLKKFVSNGGQVKVRNITSFEQLSDFDVIVNCSGLNASKLTGDTQMAPIRGQISRINAPWLFHSILTDKAYIIPNTETVILGGTAQADDYDINPRDSDTETILTNSQSIVPSIKNAEIVKHVVGLRPGRVEVRLETEMKNMKGKLIPIIHNYGHGGGGVTLAYGCALSAVILIKDAINISHKSKL